MSGIKFSCRISTNDSSIPLGLEIWLDNERIYNNNHVQETVDFEHDISDLFDGDHQLQFTLKNKQPDHTTVVDNQIVKDAVITLSQVTMSRVEIDHLLQTLAVYRHDFNGTQDAIDDEFYGQLGCNGTVSLAFTVPTYQWLLEHI